MRPARDVRGELARIEPARACCRAAELAGLRFDGGIRSLDPATVRVAVRLGAGRDLSGPADRGSGTRHHLAVLGAGADDGWSWTGAEPHDRQAFLRGVVLGSGSLSFSRTGPHVEFVFRSRSRARTLQRRLAATGASGAGPQDMSSNNSGMLGMLFPGRRGAGWKPAPPAFRAYGGAAFEAAPTPMGAGDTPNTGPRPRTRADV